VKANNKGFTLIEILVAMGIILLIAMAFFSINNMSIKVNAKNEKDIQAMNIAQSVMEDIRQDIKSSTEYIDININESTSSIEKESISTDKENPSEIKPENVEQSSNEYTVNINFSKEVDKFLYTVEVDVIPLNSNSKGANLITQIFAKK